MAKTFMVDFNKSLQEKLEKLELEYKKYGKVLIALSGGVDSCLAAYLGRKFLGGENAIAIISNSESLKEKDFKIAVDFCNQFDIKFEEIYTKELSNPEYSANPTNRCYFCKSELFGMMSEIASENYPGFTIINGNNFSDLGDYRPGLQASNEQQSMSPFISCEITKDDIRQISKGFGLPVWNKPASPCLSSRFPYGESITAEKLERVEKAEDLLNENGFEEVRVRSYGDQAKIEVPEEMVEVLKQKESTIKEKIIALGFKEFIIDEEGLVSGKLNRVL